MGRIIGQNEFKKWEREEKLTARQAILGHCYECNGFEESNEDCLGEKTCVLYRFSPHAVKRGISGVRR
jgi:hypothetical protein